VGNDAAKTQTLLYQFNIWCYLAINELMLAVILQKYYVLASKMNTKYTRVVNRKVNETIMDREKAWLSLTRKAVSNMLLTAF
jgi:hypothetical protein